MGLLRLACAISLVVAGRGAADAARPGAIGPVQTIQRANQFFLTQWGPTAFNHVRGAPDGHTNCGPTTWLMGASTHGIVPHPGPDQAEAAIRALAVAAPMGVYGYGRPGFELAGALPGSALAHRLPSTLPPIDEALAAGAVVPIRGAPRWAWGQRLNDQGAYLNDYAIHPKDFLHWSLVFGKRADGMYIVGDPLSRIGAIAVPGSEILRFWENGQRSYGIRGAWSLSRR
jgi:hypothetical protein